MKKLFLFSCIFLATVLIWATQDERTVGIHGPIITVDQRATRSIKIQWLARGAVSFSYRQQESGSWREQEATRSPFGESDHQVYRVALQDLEPDQIYEIRIGDNSYKVRTLPEAAAALSFAVGGDMMHESEMLERTTKMLARHSPAFAVLGGDFAYANGKEAKRWVAFLDAWARSAITPEGLLIPAIVVIGNHEVRGGYEKSPAEAPFFYSLFSLPERSSNYTVDIGRNLSFFLLDSNHTQRVEQQKAWLEQALSERKYRSFLFPVYHYPAYGILKKGLMNWKSQDIRTHWVPLFERYGVRIAFEHDHHIYKRSRRIRGEALDEQKGITYIGDGAYGVNTRTLPENWRDLWYVAQAASQRHFLLVSLRRSSIRVDAINETGETIDTYIDERI